jgi:hypothetical protein
MASNSSDPLDDRSGQLTNNFDPSRLNELWQDRRPEVVEAPPIQSPPVQNDVNQDEASRMAPLSWDLIRPLYWLVSVAAVSLSGPAIWFVALNLYHNAAGSVLPVWACCLFLVTLILMGYASLMRIIPNRITLYASSWAMLSCVVVSASLLGALLVAGPTSELTGGLQLETHVQFPLRISLGASVAWAFVMLNISTLVTYVLGRVAMRSAK